MEFTYNGYLWLYKSGRGQLELVVVHAVYGAIACIALPRLSTESDRQIDLS